MYVITFLSHNYFSLFLSSNKLTLNSVVLLFFFFECMAQRLYNYDDLISWEGAIQGEKEVKENVWQYEINNSIKETMKGLGSKL